MSTASKPTPPTAAHPLIELKAGIYAVAMLLSSTWIAWTLLSEERGMTFAILAVLTLLMLVTRIWLAGLVYFGVIAFLFVDEASLSSGAIEPGSAPAGLAIAVIVFLMSACRYVSLTAPILPYAWLTRTEILFEAIQFATSSLTGKPKGKLTKKLESNARLEPRDTDTMSGEELVTGAFRVFIAVFGASALLRFVPLPFDSKADVGLFNSAMRATTLGWLLVGIVVVLGLVLTPISWSRHTPREAGVFLRSVVTRWCFGDLRSMVTRLVRGRRKSLVTKLKRGGPRRVNLVDEEGAVVRARSFKTVGRRKRKK